MKVQLVIREGNAKSSFICFFGDKLKVRCAERISELTIQFFPFLKTKVHKGLFVNSRALRERLEELFLP
jgi:hypothetical protein